MARAGCRGDQEVRQDVAQGCSGQEGNLQVPADSQEQEEQGRLRSGNLAHSTRASSAPGAPEEAQRGMAGR